MAHVNTSEKTILSPEMAAAIDRLEQAANEVVNLGATVLLAARVEVGDGTHFTTGIKLPKDFQLADLDHVFADAVRDLSVEWSNLRHDSKVVWAS